MNPTKLLIKYGVIVFALFFMGVSVFLAYKGNIEVAGLCIALNAISLIGYNITMKEVMAVKDDDMRFEKEQLKLF